MQGEIKVVIPWYVLGVAARNKPQQCCQVDLECVYSGRLTVKQTSDIRMKFLSILIILLLMRCDWC